MTTYVLSLTGDERKAANATHWARFRTARLISVSRRRGERASADIAQADGIASAAHASADWCRNDPQALAALLVRTLDVQDGIGVVLADFDSEEFAADVVARIAALGRDVTWKGRVANFAFGARLRARLSRS